MWIRNKEYAAEIVIDLLLTAAGTVLCLVTALPAWAVLLACGLLMLLVHVLFLSRRYRAIAALSDSIDRVLHGQDDVLVSDSAEGELAVLNNELHKMTLRLKEQADQLKDEKTFLADSMADISHQLRTPLTSMRLVTEMLGKQTISPESRTELLRDLRSQEEKVSWLVESLLKISKIDAGTAVFEPKTVAARALLTKAAEALAISFELRGIGLILKSDGGTLEVDPDWTQEAIGNIVKNCMDHMPGGGKLRLSAQTTALYTEFVIEDSGEGFSEEDLPHIFERYYRGKNAAPDSMGIGLALAQMIITEQGGTITAENRPEGGARFIIRFYKSVL
ncbi:MAG: HAMP domain-containing histidine kinase [Lachnospiraceae bacterium]|nr:HAMP domain-containing histidine kinase [Lachnospiraceae bacterium]